MRVFLDLSKIILQYSQDLIPSWLNMPFLQKLLLLLTPVLGLTRTSLGSDSRFFNQQTTIYFLIIIYQLHVTALAIPFLGGIREIMKAGFYNLSKHARFDTLWYVYIFNTF